MKTLSSDMQAHVTGNVTTLCTCIKVVRQDNSAYLFTDHDTPVTCLGDIYNPTFGFSRTSITTTVNLEVSSAEMKGIMLSESDPAQDFLLAFTRVDIDSGLFDYAQVYVYLANYNDPNMMPISLRRGWIGEIEANEDGSYKAELRGLTQILATKIGEAYTPTCRANLGDYRCKVVLTANPWQANTGYLEGTRVLGVVTGGTYYQQLTIENASFETELPSSDPGPNVPGFTSYGDSDAWWSRQSDFYNIAAQNGAYFIAQVNQPGDSASQGGITQTISLLQGEITGTNLDTGNCRINASVWMCTSSGQAHGRFALTVLDVNQNVLKTIYDTGQIRTNSTVWVNYSCNNSVLPSGSRFITINLWSNKKGGDDQGTFFDNLDITVNLPAGTYNNSAMYGGVGFVANNSGVSGATQPDWTNEIGQTYTDGTITWTCVNAFVDVATVTSISSTDPKSFYATALTETAGYFDAGIITWETGANAGRNSEIQTWDGGLLTLLFEPWQTIAVGDRFSIYPGCDKTKSTCIIKFDNLLNFRGEPDVPGQDRYSNVANAGS